MALSRVLRATDPTDGKMYDITYTDAVGSAGTKATKVMEIVRDYILAHSSNNFSTADALAIGTMVSEQMIREGIIAD